MGRKILIRNKMLKSTLNQVDWNITLHLDFDEWVALSSAVKDSISLTEFLLSYGIFNSLDKEKKLAKIKLLKEISKELDKSNWKTLAK